MKAIAAQFQYISKNGWLEIEDQRGETLRGNDGRQNALTIKGGRRTSL